MKVVIDTNIFWISVTRKSKSNWLYQALIDGQYSLCVTTDILAEYEELIGQRIGSLAAKAVLELLELLPNVLFINRYYKWHLITSDPDDDKFTDCYVAAQAEYLVTHDKHFNLLKNLEFPSINVISLAEFKEVLRKQN